MSMEENQSLPRINIHHINILLYILIIWLVIQYKSPLHWAMREMPKYFKHKISSPVERKLYVRAKFILRKTKQIDSAKPLLEKSLAIDPNSEALFLMGEYYDKKREDDKALHHYKQYLEIDPSVATTYLRIARILEKQYKPEKARQVLNQGFVYFDKYSRKFKDRKNINVAQKYNDSARNVYIYYHQARNYFKARLDTHAAQ